MSEEPFNFEEQNDMGSVGERVVYERLKNSDSFETVEHVSYEQRPGLQLSGVDIVVNATINIDVKTQQVAYYHTGNIPVEVASSIEERDPGWVYKNSIDLVVFVYTYEDNSLFDRWLILKLNDGFKEWFLENMTDYRKVCIPNEGWTTVCRLVPIEDFPDEHLTEYDGIRCTTRCYSKRE